MNRLKTTQRFSIAGMMFLTAGVAVHVAIGRWDLGLAVFVAPFSLSIMTIEILRRMFRMSFVRSMVVGVLIGAFCYSFTIGGISAWDYWFREDDLIYRNGQHMKSPPSFGHAVSIFVRSTVFPLAWFLVAGTVVMILYTAILLYDGGRSDYIVKSRLQKRKLQDAGDVEIVSRDE